MFLKFLSKFTKDIEILKANPELGCEFIRELSSIMENPHNFYNNEIFFRKYYAEVMPVSNNGVSDLDLSNMLTGFICWTQFFDMKRDQGFIRKKNSITKMGRCEESLQKSRSYCQNYYNTIAGINKNLRAHCDDESIIFFLNLEIDLANLNSRREKYDKCTNEQKLLKLGRQLEATSSRCLSDPQMYFRQDNCSSSSSEVEYSIEKDKTVEIIRTFSSTSVDRINDLSNSFNTSFLNTDASNAHETEI